jgi:recombination protein RecA
MTLDRLLGGGIALGRITEFYGPYSALKSYTLYNIIAEAQSRGMLCALADAEKSFDPVFARYLNVDVDKLYMVGDLEQGEELIDYVETLIRSRKFGVIGIDSVAALVPKDELEESSEAAQMGKMGKLTSKMTRKLNAVNSGTTALVLINQVRENIGIHFGNPERPVGGRAIGHFASQRVEFRRGRSIKKSQTVVEDGKLKEKEITVGSFVNIRVDKDKTGANAERTAMFQYDIRKKKINKLEEILQLGLEDGLIISDGNRYHLKDENGKLMKKPFLQKLREDKHLREKLVTIIKRRHIA